MALSVNNRKIRIIGVAFVIVLCFIHFYKTGRSRNIIIQKKKEKVIRPEKENTPSSSLIGAELLDQKKEKAINKEISKEKIKEENTEPTTTSRSSASSGDIAFNPEKALNQLRNTSPIVVFSKSYCPFSKKLKIILSSEFEITPDPAIVELDMHPHGAEFQQYVGKISGRHTVPNVIVGESFESRGGCDTFEQLQREGQLLSLLRAWVGRMAIIKRKETPSNA